MVRAWFKWQPSVIDSMSTQVSAPQITAQIAIATMSIGQCSLLRSTRGSSRLGKCSKIVAAVLECIGIHLREVNPHPILEKNLDAVALRCRLAGKSSRDRQHFSQD
jgi:hypothetical protein